MSRQSISNSAQSTSLHKTTRSTKVLLASVLIAATVGFAQSVPSVSNRPTAPMAAYVLPLRQKQQQQSIDKIDVKPSRSNDSKASPALLKPLASVVYEKEYDNVDFDVLKERLLSQDFFEHQILEKANGYEDVRVGQWENDSQHDHWHRPVAFTLPQRTFSFLKIPQLYTSVDEQDGAHGTVGDQEVLVDSNDALVLRMRTQTPDAPFGKKLAVLMQTSLVQTGPRSCKFVASTQPEFFSRPLFAKQIQWGIAQATKGFMVKTAKSLL